MCLTNFGERSIPSGHVAKRVVILNTTSRCDQVKRIPSWMSKHPVFCTILKRISDGHQYSDEPFPALADFQVMMEKARKQAHQEVLRHTAGS